MWKTCGRHVQNLLRTCAWKYSSRTLSSEAANSAAVDVAFAWRRTFLANMRTGTIAAAVGKGLFAGVAGTAAITVSQRLAAKLQDGGAGDAQAEATEKVLGVTPTGDPEKERWNRLVHWAYGTAWGGVRGLLDVAGLRQAAATGAHFGLVWGTAATMLPALRIAPPPTEWPPQQIATDALHHAVYAIAAGIAYEALDRSHDS